MGTKKKPFKLDVVSIRLVKDAPLRSEYPIRCPHDAVALIGEQLCEMDKEVVCVINLRTDCTPINCSLVSIGTVNESLVHPREMLKSSILSNASSMLIVHNHPSGRLSPSQQDCMMTDRMIKMCEYMGIPLQDHIIVAGDNSQFFSFKEKGLMKNPVISLVADYHEIEFKSPMVAEEGRAR